jgi:hypothetical protein
VARFKDQSFAYLGLAEDGHFSTLFCNLQLVHFSHVVYALPQGIIEQAVYN